MFFTSDSKTGEIFCAQDNVAKTEEKNTLTHLIEPESVESIVEYLQQRNL